MASSISTKPDGTKSADPSIDDKSRLSNPNTGEEKDIKEDDEDEVAHAVSQKTQRRPSLFSTVSLDSDALDLRFSAPTQGALCAKRYGRSSRELEFGTRMSTSASMEDYLTHPSNNDSVDTIDFEHDAFLIFADDQIELARRFVSILENMGVRVFCPLVGAIMGGSAESKRLAENARVSKCAVILLSQGLIDRIMNRHVGELCLSLFTVCMSIRTIQVVAVEKDLVNPLCWGWNAVFAHFAGATIWDCSFNCGSETWTETVRDIGATMLPECRNSRIEVDQAAKDAITRVWTESRTCLVQYSGTERTSSVDSVSPTAKEKKERTSWLQRITQSNAERDYGIKLYDAFFTHNWGVDQLARDNHERVIEIARWLRGQGLEIFLDTWEMANYASIDDAMVQGMKNSSLSVVFITEKYIDKIASGGHWDNCVAEFNLSRKCPDLLPVVMEPHLRNPSSWGWNAIKVHLSAKLYIDLSWTKTSLWRDLLTLGWTPEVQKWRAACDALHQRIRHTTGTLGLSATTFMKPAPMVPQRDHILIVGASLLLCSVLPLVMLIFEIAADRELTFRSVVICISAVLRGLGFQFLMQWFVLISRKPPDFGLKRSMLPKEQVLVNFLRCTSSIMFTASAFKNKDQIHEAIGCLDRYGLRIDLCANLLSVIDIFIISRNAPWGFDGKRRFAFANCPSWASVLFVSASTFLILPSDFLALSYFHSKVVQCIGLVFFVLGAALSFYWAWFSPTYVAKYYESIRQLNASESGRSHSHSEYSRRSTAQISSSNSIRGSHSFEIMQGQFDQGGDQIELCTIEL